MVDGNDRLQRSRRHAHLPLVDLAFMTRADNKNAILKTRRPKITDRESSEW